MCNRKSGIWNNYGMDLLTSPDLIHWEGTTFDFRQGKSVFSDPDATTDCYKTDDEYAKINRVWAPQIIWDESVDKYLVYYSLLSTNTGDSYDKIYYSYADEDFKTLTQPRMFFDPGFSVIDADILYNPYDGLYHMYYKREAAGGQDRGVYEATSPVLVGGTWTDITHVTNEGTAQVEGSSHIRRINEDTYNLYYMRYSEGYVYKVCETNHVGINTTASVDLKGTGSFQHGSFITLTETEYKMLEMWDQLKNYLPGCYDKWENGYDYYEQPIQQAEAALALTDVDELAVELTKAYEALLKADERFYEQIMSEATFKKPTDVTYFTINNSNFSEGSAGWKGTAFTAANGNIAEQWNKTFDNYQILKGMPAGLYILSCQGFYRYGGKDDAVSAHKNGTERMLTELYMNTASTPFMCIYDESGYSYEGSYSYPDNVTQANDAFNNKGYYTNNLVKFNLTEAGDLRIGIRKTEAHNNDWAIFDNFRLLYCGPVESEINIHDASEENPVDMSDLIMNNSFEWGDYTGWKLSAKSSDTGVKSNSNVSYSTNGIDGDYLFYTFWKGVPIIQTVTDLPNGKYQLKVLVASGDDGGDDGQVYVTANDQRKLVVRPAGTKTTFEDVTLDFTVTDGTATFGVRGGNVDGSYREDGYFWYKADNFRLYFLGNELTLDEKDSELNFIEDFYTKVTIQRTIKADTWSTFVVPFDMEIPDGWEVKGLTDAKINNDIVSMVFSSAPSISSGVPYMIRTKSSLSEIVANNVDVTNTMNDTQMNMITFKGTYTSGYVPQNAYFMSGNKFYKAGDESNTIKGYRAYFEVNDENKVNELKFSLDEEETSFIQIKENLQDEVIYNTNGVRLKGLQKGVNIIKRPDGTTIKLVIK
jgi:hypothetical protein